MAKIPVQGFPGMQESGKMTEAPIYACPYSDGGGCIFGYGQHCECFDCAVYENYYADNTTI